VLFHPVVRLASDAQALQQAAVAGVTRAPEAVPAPDGSASEPALPVFDPFLGFTISAHHISDLPLYLESVDRIAALGADSLLVLTPMYQKRIDSTTIRFLPRRCATDDQLVAILSRARERGLRTALMPIVLIEKPGRDDWRGTIRPDDWEAWWASYDGVIDRALGLAARVPIDLLFLGSELNTTQNQPHRWKRIVQRVRASYSGLVSYSDNWDRYDRMTHWDLFDCIAISAYFEISRDQADDSVPILAAAWARERDRLLAYAAAIGRPLILSEIGYPSLSTAARYPWDYTNRRGRGRPDPDAQARAWEAFFTAWTPGSRTPGSRTPGSTIPGSTIPGSTTLGSSTPGIKPSESTARGTWNAELGAQGTFRGLFGYCWDPYHIGTPGDTGYGIAGKPAELVVRRGFAAMKHALQDD
jgi:hypothetical protein